jgi:phage shock protein E
MKYVLSIALILVSQLGTLAAQNTKALPPKIGYAELASRLEDGKGAPLLLDVRTAEEFREGHIPGAALVPYDELERSFGEAKKDKPIVVYCRSGRRSAIAMRTLAGMGYTNLSDFGAIANWRGTLTKGD